MDIEQAVKGSVDGDRQAQRELFRNCRATVLRLVWRLLGPMRPEQADEVVQDVFVQLFRGLARFRWESSFDTWLHRIVAAVCMDTLRRKYRRYEQSVERPGDVDGVADSRDAPDAVAERAEMNDAVHAALRSLDPERRAVFVLVEMEGKGLEEAAVILGRPLGTVKSRLFRARNDLARLLGPVLDEHLGEEG